MSETAQICGTVIIAVLALLMVAAGVTTCGIRDKVETTERVRIICSGDLKEDGARAAACALLAQKSGPIP